MRCVNATRSMRGFMSDASHWGGALPVGGAKPVGTCQRAPGDHAVVAVAVPQSGAAPGDTIAESDGYDGAMKRAWVA